MTGYQLLDRLGRMGIKTEADLRRELRALRRRLETLKGFSRVRAVRTAKGMQRILDVLESSNTVRSRV